MMDAASAIEKAAWAAEAQPTIMYCRTRGCPGSENCKNRSAMEATQRMPKKPVYSCMRCLNPDPRSRKMRRE